MRVDDVISGRDGLGGVQWLLSGGEPRGVLRRVLRTMLERPRALGSCSLTRAKYRANHKLTATFEVSVRDNRGSLEQMRPVVVVWSGGDKQKTSPGKAVSGLQAEALRRGTSAPFRELAATEPAWNMRVQVAPLDERFPQLVRLSDPAYASEALGRLAARPQVRWVRYRPGQRHLLQYDVATSGGKVWTGFVKIYSDEPGARRVYQDAARVCEWLSARNDGVTSVRPLGSLAGDTAVVFPRAPGTRLSAYLERPYPGLQHLLAQAGAALRLLQGAPVSLAGAGARWDVAKQVAAARLTGEHRLTLLPSAADSLRRLLDRVQKAEARSSRLPDVFGHCDYKADHLYVSARGLTIIDFDNCALCDSGYDAGKFLADLHWWLSAYGTACVEQAQAHFLAGYAPGPELLFRVRLWEALMLVSLGLRRAPWSNGDWAARLAFMFDRADRALRRLEGAN